MRDGTVKRCGYDGCEMHHPGEGLASHSVERLRRLGDGTCLDLDEWPTACALCCLFTGGGWSSYRAIRCRPQVATPRSSPSAGDKVAHRQVVRRGHLLPDSARHGTDQRLPCAKDIR